MVALNLIVRGTENILRSEEAKRFCEEHVVIKRAHLEEIKRVAIEKGVFDAFKALEVEVYDLVPRTDRGDW